MGLVPTIATATRKAILILILILMICLPFLLNALSQRASVPECCDAPLDSGEALSPETLSIGAPPPLLENSSL